MCGGLVEFVVIWYIFHILVCLDQEKSGNHDRDPGITSEPDPKIVFFFIVTSSPSTVSPVFADFRQAGKKSS
jgi:hypothetical protein